MRALAYYHGPMRIRRMAEAFLEGCKRHAIPCELRTVEGARQEMADIVWLYGLGPAKPVFDLYPNARRLVGDKGYFSEYVKGYIRVSVDAQQPDKHLTLRPHSPKRWHRLGIDQAPVINRGDYVLLCGMGPKQATRQGLAYGQWERETFERIRALTERPILVREKPKNEPIHGLPRSGHGSTWGAIRDAWAVVCLTGNIGADCIVEGIPVFAEAGPGRVYYPHDLTDLETVAPLSPEARISALADICHWQWTLSEMASGDFMAHLKEEGLV